MFLRIIDQTENSGYLGRVDGGCQKKLRPMFEFFLQEEYIHQLPIYFLILCIKIFHFNGVSIPGPAPETTTDPAKELFCSWSGTKFFPWGHFSLSLHCVLILEEKNSMFPAATVTSAWHLWLLCLYHFTAPSRESKGHISWACCPWQTRHWFIYGDNSFSPLVPTSGL